ncbi:MAG: DEAD/DEAH box helicase [Saprospiraceae bacterium]
MTMRSDQVLAFCFYMTKVPFSSLPLSAEIMQAVEEMGFEFASPIQAEAIPHILGGNDVIGQAQTGTGKTAAFGIPMIERLMGWESHVTALVLCPTRELSLQVSNELIKLAKHKKGVFVLPVYGGESIVNQIKALKKGVQIVVGTPGRIIDHLDRGSLKLNDLQMVVLDEADEMLNMGFREDIETILKNTPAEKQTVLFSATMPKAILDIANQFQTNPVLVKVTTEKLAAATIEQFCYDTTVQQKPELISAVMDTFDIKQAMVFTNMKVRADEVVEMLKELGHKAEAIHGDLSQNQRNSVLASFRKGDINIMVATDVAARGIDVPNVDAVFNFDIPYDAEYYVHRIGRTGRAGREGIAVSFITGRNDRLRLQDIERFSKQPIPKRPVPAAKDRIQTVKEKFYTKIASHTNAGDLDLFDKMITEYCQQGLSPKQVAIALLRELWPANLNPNPDMHQTHERTFEPAPRTHFRERGGDFNRGPRKEKSFGGGHYKGKDGGGAAKKSTGGGAGYKSKFGKPARSY